MKNWPKCWIFHSSISLAGSTRIRILNTDPDPGHDLKMDRPGSETLDFRPDNGLKRLLLKQFFYIILLGTGTSITFSTPNVQRF